MKNKDLNKEENVEIIEDNTLLEEQPKVSLYNKIKKKYKKIKKKIKKRIRRIKTLINRLLLIIVNRILIVICPLNTKKVLFLSDVREELGGNLEYLYNIIPGENYIKVISTKPDRRIKRSLKEKIRLVYHISTAKYILLDDFSRTTAYTKVRKNQELVQLWHGPGAFKKFAHSRSKGDLENVKIHPGYKKYTKAITSSEDIRKCYAEAFSISKRKVKATGFPRTDMFFDEELLKKRKEIVYEKYPFLKNKKVILFAPTYRGKFVSGANYDFDRLDLDKIYNKLKDDYIFIFKWHPALYNNIQKGKREGYDLDPYNGFYHDISLERDINDLLLVTDVLITDYSSVIFDYVFMNKPIIYFAYDLDEYENGRGLYFPYKEYIYGKIAKTDTQLINAIIKGDMQEEKRKKFINKFLGACDGHSSEKTYEFIFGEKIEKEKKNKK